jgi:hypothetical protein
MFRDEELPLIITINHRFWQEEARVVLESVARRMFPTMFTAGRENTATTNVT